MSYVHKTLGGVWDTITDAITGSPAAAGKGFQVTTSMLTSTPSASPTASMPTASTSASTKVDKGYGEFGPPGEPCNYEGGWKLYRGGEPWNKSPRWLCQETNPDHFPDPPGWMWKGGTNKRVPWYWEQVVAKGTGPKRYYHKAIKDGATQLQWRYTPAGQVGPAGPGPVWYNDRKTSDASEQPLTREANDAYWGRACEKAGVPPELIPACVQALKDKAAAGGVRLPDDANAIAAELSTTGSGGRSKLFLYGGLAAAGLIGALLYNKRKR